jgi:hypothetical protein
VKLRNWTYIFAIWIPTYGLTSLLYFYATGFSTKPGTAPPTRAELMGWIGLGILTLALRMRAHIQVVDGRLRVQNWLQALEMPVDAAVALQSTFWGPFNAGGLLITWCDGKRHRVKRLSAFGESDLDYLSAQLRLNLFMRTCPCRRVVKPEQT